MQNTEEIKCVFFYAMQIIICAIEPARFRLSRENILLRHCAFAFFLNY